MAIQLQRLSIQTANDAAASSLKDISATPLALARIRLANAATLRVRRDARRARLRLNRYGRSALRLGSLQGRLDNSVYGFPEQCGEENTRFCRYAPAAIEIYLLLRQVASSLL